MGFTGLKIINVNQFKQNIYACYYYIYILYPLNNLNVGNIIDF